MLEGFVRIKSKRVCHRTLYGKVGEIFGYTTNYFSDVVRYGVSFNGKDYEFFEYELEQVDSNFKEDNSMKKEINRVSFEIEHYNGDTYMGFMLSIKEDGSVEVIKESDCSLADVETDYIFETNNNLYRMQADEPISEYVYDEIWNCYKEHNE
jgi:hypothetical protein